MKKIVFFGWVFIITGCSIALATPSTLIWSPSTDARAFKKVHIDADNYTPVKSKDNNDNRLYVQQVYGATFGLLPEDKVMAEAGFDYKKGFGPSLDSYPWYFNFKVASPENAFFKNMPAIAIGGYDLGTKHNKTDNRVWYLRAAKTIDMGKINLGRFSGGFFNGNARLLRDKNSERDNIGPMFAWERIMTEISDKLWVCVDYQGTQSAYGALNFGFSWKFTDNLSAIIGYDIYNNSNAKDTITFQLDIDF